jgi:prevent-host-death family protein
MKVVNTVELKNKTNQLIRSVMKGEAIIITHRGKPAASLTTLGEDDLEDFVLENSRKIKKMIAEAESARLKGKTISLEDFLRS